MPGLLSDVLPAVYSASNVMKNKLRGLLDDPLGTLQQALGDANDRARSFNELGARATAESEASIKAGKGLGMGSPSNQELLAKIADAYNPVAMTAIDAKSLPMAIFDTTGLPNRGRDLIQSKAETLAGDLRAKGFDVDLQHSGSAAGPSSYIKIFDPETSRFFNKDVRISGHSKGAFNSQNIMNVASDDELNSVVSSALSMRNMGQSDGMKQINNLENKAQEFIGNGMKPKSAYKAARDFLDSQKNDQPVNALRGLLAQ